MKSDRQKIENYLQDKIGLINASIAGHSAGVSYSAKVFGRTYHYDDGEHVRQMIDKDIRKIFKYAYKLGKKSNEKN